MFAASKSGKAAAAAAATDASFAYVPLLLETTGTNGQQNNTFLDSSTNAFTITRNGTPTQGSRTPYWPNGQWSNYFNGSTDYLSLATSTAFGFGTGDYTIETWIYSPNPATGTIQTIVDLRNTTGPSPVQINLTATGFPAAYNGTTYTSSTAITGSTWNHIALVRNGSGTNNCKLYVNGTQTAQFTDTSDYGSTHTCFIARNAFSAVEYFNGYMSNVRLVKGTAVYTANFTPSTTPLTATQSANVNGNPSAAITGTATSLLTCQSNRFIDNSSTPKTITIGGTPSVQAFQPFAPAASYSAATYAGSGYFNGSTDYLTLPASSALTLTADFTIEFWVYSGAFASGASNPSLFNTSAASIFYESNGSNRGLCLFVGSAIITTATTVLPNNQWNHVVCVRSGSTVSMFVNGSRVGTNASFSSTADFSSTFVNRYFGSAAGYLNGYMSNLRVVKGVAIYDPAQTTITVPTTPVTNTAQTSLLLNMANAGIYDAAAQNNMTTVGDAQVSTTQSKWSPSSILFNGSSDYLNLNAGATAGLTFGTSNFTIEFWIYFNSNTGFQTIYDGRAAAGAYPLLYLNSGVINYYVGGGVAITSIQPSTGVWYFMSLIRSSGTTRFFINGTQSGGSYADSNNYLAPPTSGARIGANYTGSAFLSAYVQDFRVTKGVARASTPIPTAAFPTR